MKAEMAITKMGICRDVQIFKLFYVPRQKFCLNIFIVTKE